MDGWTILDLDPLAAARAGLPEQVAVPAGADPAAATPAELAAFAARFAEEEPDHPLAPELRRLAAKERERALAADALADRRWDEALDRLGRVLELDPQDAPARLNRAAALREAGDPAAALADLVRRDLALHDDDHAHLATAARALLAEDQPDLAATAAALALAVEDGDEATRLVLADALLAAGRPAEALAAAERHVGAVPASAVGHEQRAVALARLGRGEEALVAARRALELDPAAPQAGRIVAGDLP